MNVETSATATETTEGNQERQREREREREGGRERNLLSGVRFEAGASGKQ